MLIAQVHVKVNAGRRLNNGPTIQKYKSRGFFLNETSPPLHV